MMHVYVMMVCVGGVGMHICVCVWAHVHTKEAGYRDV